MQRGFVCALRWLAFCTPLHPSISFEPTVCVTDRLMLDNFAFCLFSVMSWLKLSASALAVWRNEHVHRNALDMRAGIIANVHRSIHRIASGVVAAETNRAVWCLVARRTLRSSPPAIDVPGISHAPQCSRHRDMVLFKRELCSTVWFSAQHVDLFVRKRNVHSLFSHACPIESKQSVTHLVMLFVLLTVTLFILSVSMTLLAYQLMTFLFSCVPSRT